jgi:NAD(P)-dependent dehydrogenase (short-subunit alcohol dehydrogenase family)
MNCDVLVWKELRALFSHAKKKYGRVDFVFANAGINQAFDVFEDKLDEDGELLEPQMPVIDVNLKSVITSMFGLSYEGFCSIPIRCFGNLP